MKAKYFIYLLLFCGSFSCDIMDKAPLDIISEEAVWNDKALINSYISIVFSSPYPIFIHQRSLQ